MKNKVLSIVVLVCLGVGCKDKAEERDGSGMFEAREVIVSSEISGRIERLDVMEGDYIEAGKVVGLIDTMQLHWLKVQAQQAVKAVDPASFMMVLESNEVHGEGFRYIQMGD